MADQPVMTGEQVLLVSFHGNADLDSGRSSLYIYMCVCVCSALLKYWNSKDKIALLAVESRHLQI